MVRAALAAIINGGGKYQANTNTVHPELVEETGKTSQPSKKDSKCAPTK